MELWVDMKTNYIEIGKLKGDSDELIRTTIIKEYLIGVSADLSSEISRETKEAKKKNVPDYLINIFEKKLKERKSLIDRLMQISIDEYWEIVRLTD